MRLSARRNIDQLNVTFGVLTADVNNLRFLIRVYEKLAAASKHYSAKQGVHSLVLSGTPCESQEHLAVFVQRFQFCDKQSFEFYSQCFAQVVNNPRLL